MSQDTTNQTDGETTPQKSNFTGFNKDYPIELHLKMQKVGVNDDLELSKKIQPNDSVSLKQEPLEDGSHFTGEDKPPFDKKVEPPVMTIEKKSTQTGEDNRKENKFPLI